MAMEWLAPFQTVSHSAPLRVMLEAVGRERPGESAEFLGQLDELEDLEASCPWERSYEPREGPDGKPPEGDPEPPPESFGARMLRERREKAAAEAEFKRTGEPALPSCGPCRPKTAEDYARMNEQATKLRKMREELIGKVPAETVRLCSGASEALGKLAPPEPEAMRCGSEGVYAGRGKEVHAAVWVRAPAGPALAAPRRVDMILCVDTSGSMSQDMPVVRSVLTKLVRRAQPKDRLCLITFASTANLQLGWTECNSEGKKRLHEVVDGLEAEGRTAFVPALEKVFEQVEGTKNRPVQVVFMSDGKPDDSAYYICAKLRRRLPLLDVSFSTVAFGSKVDSPLMAHLSLMGRGHHTFVNGMAMVGSAIGRLFAWAQHMAGECFLVVRGLGGCKILDMEEGYGRVQLKDGSKASLVLLGNLLHNQRRAVALRLVLPNSVRVPLQDLEQPLVECTFFMRPASGADRALKVARCDLKALQVPSLLIEGVLGFPLRVYLKEEFYTAFDEERRKRLESALCGAMSIPESALVVDRVREGSVIVDAHVALPAKEVLPILKKLNLAALEHRLREEGFAVGAGTEGFIEVPGQLTAQRWLQWATANNVAEKPLVKVSAVAELNGGPLGCLDQRTAAAVSQDVWATGRREGHWRLQLQAAHLRAFPSDPEAHASLRAYDTHELREGAQALDSRNGAPVKWLKIKTDGEGGREGYSLQLVWEGALQGPHWLVTVEPEGPGSEILTCFRNFDQNGDGVISPDELSRVLQTIDPQAWTKDRTHALLQVIDTNGDGLIQYNEFVAWLTAGDDSWDQLRQDIGIARDTAQRLTRRRVKIADKCSSFFDALAADVYRVTVKGADMQGSPGMYGQCWVCIGLNDLTPVVALLEAQEGEGGLLQFSPNSWIGWGTMKQQAAN